MPCATPTKPPFWSGRGIRPRCCAASPRASNPDELDWPNIIEEIESVGREQRHAVESRIVRALVHILKAEARRSQARRRIGRPRRGFRGDAAGRSTPSMRQRINMADLYGGALRRLPETIDGQPPLPAPAVCPVTLDELLAAG